MAVSESPELQMSRRDFLKLSATLSASSLLPWPDYTYFPDSNLPTDRLISRVEQAGQNCYQFIKDNPDLVSVSHLFKNPAANSNSYIQEVFFSPLTDFKILNGMRKAALFLQGNNPNRSNEEDRILYQSLMSAFTEVIEASFPSGIKEKKGTTQYLTILESYMPPKITRRWQNQPMRFSEPEVEIMFSLRLSDYIESLKKQLPVPAKLRSAGIFFPYDGLFEEDTIYLKESMYVISPDREQDFRFNAYSFSHELAHALDIGSNHGLLQYLYKDKDLAELWRLRKNVINPYPVLNSVEDKLYEDEQYSISMKIAKEGLSSLSIEEIRDQLNVYPANIYRWLPELFNIEAYIFQGFAKDHFRLEDLNDPRGNKLFKENYGFFANIVTSYNKKILHRFDKNTEFNTAVDLPDKDLYDLIYLLAYYSVYSLLSPENNSAVSQEFVEHMAEIVRKADGEYMAEIGGTLFYMMSEAEEISSEILDEYIAKIPETKYFLKAIMLIDDREIDKLPNSPGNRDYWQINSRKLKQKAKELLQISNA